MTINDKNDKTEIYPVVEMYLKQKELIASLEEKICKLEECLPIALDALNFACGSDNREIYKCCGTAIREITDILNNSGSVKENS